MSQIIMLLSVILNKAKRNDEFFYSKDLQTVE